MTRQRVALYALLAIVAAAAAVLSFSALRDLALVCGFGADLAWLLPVVVDAGAAAGSLVWLGGGAPADARRFARALALTLLALSVAANALGHGLEAFRLAPAWWVVVIVSAVAPAVLGAVVHLAVLVGREQAPATAEQDEQGPGEAGEQDEQGGEQAPDDGEQPGSPKATDEEVLAHIRAADEVPSGAALRARYCMGWGRAARLLDQAAREREHHPPLQLAGNG